MELYGTPQTIDYGSEKVLSKDLCPQFSRSVCITVWLLVINYLVYIIIQSHLIPFTCSPAEFKPFKKTFKPFLKNKN